MLLSNMLIPNLWYSFDIMFQRINLCWIRGLDLDDKTLESPKVQLMLGWDTSL